MPKNILLPDLPIVYEGEMFSCLLARSKMQTAFTRNWTRVTDSISNEDNCYAKENISNV